jgi:hypothetical protein
LLIPSSVNGAALVCSNKACEYNLRLVSFKIGGEFCAIAFHIFGITFGFWDTSKSDFNHSSKLMKLPLSKVDFSNKEKLLEKCKLYSTFT